MIRTGPDHLDPDSTSYERASAAVAAGRALIEKSEHDEYSVMLPEYSEGVHRVQYQISRFGGHRVSTCDCSHYEHRKSLCAHQIAVALSDELRKTTVRGRSIEPYQYDRHQTDTDTDDLTDDQLPADHPAVESVADGGRDPEQYAAGSDGRDFGAPEGDL